MDYLLGIMSLILGNISPAIIGGQEYTLAFIPLLPLLILGLGFALQILFPTKTEQIGPRIDDLKIVTSTYGDHLARVYGRAKIAGAVIWVENNKVKEVTTTTITKQKLFGLFTIGTNKTVEFTYFATFAMAFTHHEITDFGKVYVDDEIWHDFTGTGNIGSPVTRFKGNAFQTPPNQMVNDNGIANTPAYRGISYLFFNTLPLEEIGVRIPNVEAEIIVGAEAVSTQNFYEQGFTNHFTRSDDVDFNQNIVYNGGTGIVIWDKHTRQIKWREDVETRDGITGAAGGLLDGGGLLYVTNNLQQSTPDLHVYDVFTSQLIVTFAGLFDSIHFAMGCTGEDEITGDKLIYFYKGVHGTLLRTTPLREISFINFEDNLELLSTSDAKAICMRNANSSTGRIPTAWVAGAGTKLSSQDLQSGNATIHDIEAGLGSFDLTGICYVSLDDTLILMDESNNNLKKVPADNPTILLKTLDFPDNFDQFTQGGKWMWSRRSPSPEGLLVLADSGGSGNDIAVLLVDAVNLEIVEIFTYDDINDVNITGSDYVYDWRNNSIISWQESVGFGIRQTFLPRATSGKIPISTIISTEAELAGLDANQIDVSGITGDTWGYSIKDSTTPRAVIEDVNRVKSKEFAQVDGILKFFNKAVTPVATIFLDDIGATLSGAPSATRVEELISDATEIPKAVTLEYPAFDANYRTGAQKITVPDGLDPAKQQLQFNTNMTMTDDEAAQSADIILSESRDVALQYNTSILPKYSDLHPGDVVSLQLDTNRQENVVMKEITQDIILEIETYRRQFDFASNAVGSPTNDGTLVRPVLAQALFQGLDIPIVRITDDESGFYWALYTDTSGTFLSAIVNRSDDLGATFVNFASVNQEAFVASAVEALAGGIEKAWTIDEITTLDVTSLAGTLESVTLEQALNGENLFAIQNGINWELFNAVDVTEISAGRYTLSRLIRGRNGTENYIDGHTVGNLIFRLNSVDIGLSGSTNNIFRSSEDSKDVVYDYLATTIGLPLDPSTQVQFINTAVGKRPYAPWPVKATRDVSENLDIVWVRRDRLFHHWLGGVAPLTEASEAYEIDLFEGMSALATITGLSSPLFEYTLVAYKTDSGNSSATVIPTLTVFVYQISTIFGRGEAIEVDL